MVSTADGRATVGGRSGPISDRADRELFHGLRTAVDARAGGRGHGAHRALRTDHPGRLAQAAATAAGAQRGAAGVHRLRAPGAGGGHPAARRARRAGGDPDRLRGEPARDAPPTSTTCAPHATARWTCRRRWPSCASASPCTALLCEGGPHLACQLLAAGLVDELFLSLSPLLAGGEPSGGEALRILAGAELEPPVELELLGVLQQRLPPVPALRRLRAASASRARRRSAARSPADGPAWPPAAWPRSAPPPPRRRAPRA